MVVISAARIERRIAGRALVERTQILSDAQLDPTCSTQHRWLIPFATRPDSDRVIGQCIVAALASIVEAATLHFDCDDVEFAVVVGAASLRVEVDSHDAGAQFSHGFRVED